MRRHLFVNGIGMTTLTPITKYMVHLPLALQREPPRDVLVICFGMGTSFRSALSWGAKTTAVELVPSVPSLVGFFHPDGEALLRSPLGRVVIDDGRRFLEREAATYDLILLDPPPPVEAAGSSLLYSRELYRLIQKRLRPTGILQQWFPTGEPGSLSAVARALQESFPYVRAFGSIEGWGYHFFASQLPIEFDPSPSGIAALVQRMPDAARRDLTEWGPSHSPLDQLTAVLSKEVALEALIRLADVPTMQDDRPVNEYFLLRRGGLKALQR